MQKTMIALWGISELGKSTTIRLAYDDLRKDLPEEDIVKSPGRTRKNLNVNGAILKIDGVLVGFASQGDNPEVLEKFLMPLIAAGCVVIVCATHTRRSETYDLVPPAGRRAYVQGPSDSKSLSSSGSCGWQQEKG